MHFLICRASKGDDRARLLEHNRFYRILVNKSNTLATRALSGENANGTPATLSAAEAADLTTYWLRELCEISLAQSKSVDKFRLKEEDFVRWTDALVECFPGEAKHRWYSPKPTPASGSLKEVCIVYIVYIMIGISSCMASS